jgi:hypothetical protein
MGKKATSIRVSRELLRRVRGVIAATREAASVTAEIEIALENWLDDREVELEARARERHAWAACATWTVPGESGCRDLVAERAPGASRRDAVPTGSRLARHVAHGQRFLLVGGRPSQLPAWGPCRS